MDYKQFYSCRLFCQLLLFRQKKWENRLFFLFLSFLTGTPLTMKKSSFSFVIIILFRFVMSSFFSRKKLTFLHKHTLKKTSKICIVSLNWKLEINIIISLKKLLSNLHTNFHFNHFTVHSSFLFSFSFLDYSYRQVSVCSFFMVLFILFFFYVHTMICEYVSCSNFA